MIINGRARILLLWILLSLGTFSNGFHLQPRISILRPRENKNGVASVLTGGASHNSFRTRSSQLYSQDKDEDVTPQLEGADDVSLLDTIGLISQPIVWISLYSVATTGAGLPAGPFGLLGAVEGIAYLVVVGFVVASIARAPSLKLVESLSFLTLGAGIFTLCVLVAQQGCVPNAKPILDYSDYLPVCNPEQTPGLFGG